MAKTLGKCYLLAVACANDSFSFLTMSLRILLRLVLICHAPSHSLISSIFKRPDFYCKCKMRVTSSALTPLYHKVSLFHKRHIIWNTNRTSSNQLVSSLLCCIHTFLTFIHLLPPPPSCVQRFQPALLHISTHLVLACGAEV